MTSTASGLPWKASLGVPDLDVYPVAYFEVVWGEEAMGWNYFVVDMEKVRRGVSPEDLPMRQPEYSHEVELLVRHLRGLADDIALQYRLNHLVSDQEEPTRVGSVPEDPDGEKS